MTWRARLTLIVIREKDPNAKKGFSKIKTIFYIETDNTEEEIRDFIDFVNNTCPVHDIIVNAPEFETEIVTK
ncbi:OsmC family protein [Tetragenococcus muriaticus]|uniref:OsmC family protein n=1 Tax=Tetragenococcus muriaticus TaxID=64642 RepID=UPI002F352F94